MESGGLVAIADSSLFNGMPYCTSVPFDDATKRTGTQARYFLLLADAKLVKGTIGTVSLRHFRSHELQQELLRG